MSGSVNAPSGIDMSACTVSTDGGNTSQTLAALVTAQNATATAVAQAQSVATAAKTESDQASQDAAGAATALKAIPTIYIPQAAYNAANGVAKLDQNYQFVAPPSVSGTTYGNFGFVLQSNGATSPDPNCQLVLLNYNIGAFNKQVSQTVWGSADVGPFMAFNGASYHPNSDGSADLGMADHGWNNIYSKTAVQVTSDATQKTIVGSLEDTEYTDGQKLVSALFGIDTEMFKLNASIAEDPTAARLHAGFIAQKVAAVITAAGLNPSDYALWTDSPVYEKKSVDTGKKASDGSPIMSLVVSQKLDADGKPMTTQMLRYEQILCVLYTAAKEKLAAQATALEALTARVTALESAASPKSGGSN